MACPHVFVPASGRCSLLTGDHALDGAVLPRMEHVEGLLELFKLKAMSDERHHVHQLLGQQVNGDGKAGKQA